jgi:DNA primase
VREIEGLDFVDAVEELAKRSGVTLRYDDNTKNRDRSRRDRLVEAVAAAGAYYHKLLLEAPEGGTARKYLRGRGFDGDAARQFTLGWAPDDWDALSRHLQREKFSRDDLIEAGLAFVNKANRLHTADSSSPLSNASIPSCHFALTGSNSVNTRIAVARASSSRPAANSASDLRM